MSANPWAGEAYVQAGHYDRVVTLALNAGVISQRTPEPDASATLHPSLQLIGTLDNLSALTDRLAELSGDVQDEFFFRQTMDLIDMASIGKLDASLLACCCYYASYLPHTRTEQKLETVTAMTKNLSTALACKVAIQRRLQQGPPKDALHIDARHHDSVAELFPLMSACMRSLSEHTGAIDWASTSKAAFIVSLFAL